VKTSLVENQRAVQSKGHEEGAMAASSEQFMIGAEASCTDGPCGTLSRVVIDPVARELTHLVIGPKHPPQATRLVPVGLADATADGIQLRCTLAEFSALNPAEVTQFIEGTIEYPAYGPEQAVFWPYYGYRGERGAMVTTDAIPPGELEVSRGDRVHATDGEIGRVHGLVIDPDSHHVTHVLLQEGHLWGHKQVTIPVSAVAKVDDRVELNLTKQQVADLPPVDIDHPG
jgi:sporulation protein YlmC with PRC-barrel domain